MAELVNIVTPLHQATTRDYVARMTDEKIYCMGVAQQYGPDYWDGERRYGYGGYRFIPGRWQPVAQALIDRYHLSGNSSVLDVGCGKGFLLYELKMLLPGLTVAGFDISSHGINDARPEVRESLFIHQAQDRHPYKNGAFDLVISLGCLHNLRLPELEIAIPEIQRVGKNGYIMLESYRNNAELFNLQCWALTAQSFLDVDEWRWLYRRLGYTGDYEFIFFE
ncbi:MAG: class I SAM-dependent methyltransferase [Gammaproteobacteria bacterium]|jgi:SAM-dependent methyltransferase|nr:class I SAM-dependent methyltransferase [Gammaproteobacteria bacterium]|tara:strand:+ start:9630 stop:10295 length:666 start_codon:yes stop_codon:yes gene_type:complete